MRFNQLALSFTTLQKIDLLHIYMASETGINIKNVHQCTRDTPTPNQRQRKSLNINCSK